MSFRIGNIIKELVKEKKLKAGEVGDAISKTKQTVYQVYNEQGIHSDRLIELSILLNTNLFSYFREHELLKGIPDPFLTRLENEIEQQKKLLAEKDQAITEKDQKIKMLEQLNAYQQSEIDKLKKPDTK